MNEWNAVFYFRLLVFTVWCWWKLHCRSYTIEFFFFFRIILWGWNGKRKTFKKIHTKTKLRMEMCLYMNPCSKIINFPFPSSLFAKKKKIKMRKENSKNDCSFCYSLYAEKEVTNLCEYPMCLSMPHVSHNRNLFFSVYWTKMCPSKKNANGSFPLFSLLKYNPIFPFSLSLHVSMWYVYHVSFDAKIITFYLW